MTAKDTTNGVPDVADTLTGAPATKPTRRQLTKRLSSPYEVASGRSTVFAWTPAADVDGWDFRITDVRPVVGGAGVIECVHVDRERVSRWGPEAVCSRYQTITVEIRNSGDTDSRYTIEIEGEALPPPRSRT